MEQKTVKIIGFKAQNHNIIKTVVLTPDLLQRRLIQLVGDSGNGKSTLIEMLQTAVAGTDAIKKKSILEKGYLAEALLLDGEVKIYVGARVTEYQRGSNAGEPKFETFLYSKDNNGAEVTPIIDGVKAIAGNYIKLLTTDLTFNMPSLFTENQTEHRKLIESLFKPELDALGADAVVARIVEAKKHRDACRALCQGSGAYMERFEEEGYTETGLNLIKKPDILTIEDKLFNRKLEKDRLTSGSEDRYKLEEERMKSARVTELQAIKDSGMALREKARKDMEVKTEEYNKQLFEYNKLISEKGSLEISFATLMDSVAILREPALSQVVKIIEAERVERLRGYEIMPPAIPSPDVKIEEEIRVLTDKYKALEAQPMPVVNREAVDTTAIDEEIRKIEEEKESAQAIADLYDRYQLWKNWIEAKGLYEKEIDTLRRMYASIDVGVQGMKIVPMETDSDRVEVWIQYDGSYDPAFFHNEEKEHRFIFQYSSFQRSAIGVMLQAARLNLKPKALRLAIVDDVAFTSKGLAVLEKMCEDFNVQLITARTDDYDKTNIPEGEIVVEGGEVFFNKK